MENAYKYIKTQCTSLVLLVGRVDEAYAVLHISWVEYGTLDVLQQLEVAARYQPIAVLSLQWRIQSLPTVGDVV